MANEFAPDGQVYVCSACGKRSKDLYGNQPIDNMWDESCMLHAVLCYDKQKTGKDGPYWEAVSVIGK